MTRRKPAAKAEVPVIPEELTVEQKFIEEFLIDRDPLAAAIRAGVHRINAKARVKNWMGDPTIQRQIQLRTDTSDVEKMISEQRIIANWIEIANDRLAPTAARNSALRELANLKRMYPDQQKGEDKSRNVLMVPGDASIENWDEAAQASQQRLKDDVRN